MTVEEFSAERSGNLPAEHLNVGQVLVAENRGTCGGVKMALETTRQVLKIVDGQGFEPYIFHLPSISLVCQSLNKVFNL